MSDCCLRGFEWDAKPQGREATLEGTFTNTRLLADHYAEEVGATVYIPVLFAGEIHPLNVLQDQTQWHKLDLLAFLERNAKHIREPQVIDCAKTLRSRHRRIGAIGLCYGGWATFRLGDNRGLVDCISTAHPYLLEKCEIEAVAVPVQIMAPEFDPMFTDELKEFSNQTILRQGVAYDYQYFPGLEHAFASRGDPKNSGERKGMEREKNSAVSWFRQWLLEM
ncbi:hypothetical protein N7449_005839 [Penicillium cf. viridicatum]|uniref:Dienelactone hydrolase domain-containing protein n=1 Tax=Penicillium cf. viridicatum TaxID=2972119 RepID=A0A9W9SWJ0_9EURO|nr:hypothetical protein N7449_005839 [Penicillium cf. viridicatum]